MWVGRKEGYEMKHLIEATIIVGLAFVMGVILVEWMAGCGDHHIDANGVAHQNQCLFIKRKE
jgi:hypothetical protein